MRLVLDGVFNHMGRQSPAFQQALADRLTIRPISEEASRLLLAKYRQLDTTAIAQIMFLASGRPALISRLAGKPSELADIGAVIKDSQALIAGPINDKLTVAARYTDRKATLELLRYSILLVQNAAAKNNTRAPLRVRA